MTDELTKQESSISTEQKEFKPTPHMEKWIDTAISLETDEIAKIAEESRIDRTTWYTWLKLPGFIDWYNKMWEERVRGHSWKLDVYGFKQAKRDTKALELMMKRTGKIQDKPNSMQQINIGSQGGNSITFTNFSNEPKS